MRLPALIVSIAVLAVFIIAFKTPGTVSVLPQPALESAERLLSDEFAAVGSAKKTKTATTTLVKNKGYSAVASFSLLRNSIVNLYCVSNDARIRSMSGSGVVVSSNGTILTAAHVGQYFLLADSLPKSAITCSVRTGSPATIAYTAKPLFVSSLWINQNTKTLTQTLSVGTGENDFALLAITGTGTNTPLPKSFNFIPLTKKDPTLTSSALVGTYGAEFVGSEMIQKNLFPILDFAIVKDRFTFQKTTTDLISLSRNAGAQEGSSGGGVANDKGELIGLITTSSNESDISKRELHAITANYIRRAFLKETGTTLDTYLNAVSTSILASNYTYKASALATILLREL